MGGKSDLVKGALDLTADLLRGAEEPVTTGIRAYHGSPHDFDKFDLSKIGTGEGAQAYGHGLYFAENEGVAKSYRDALTDHDQVKIRVNDKHIPSVWTEDLRSTFPEMYKNLSPDDADTMDALLGTMESAYSLNDAANAAESVGGRARYLYNQRVKPFVTKPEVGKGSMYEVNIAADPNTFLDWDKPLSEQPESVLSVARPFFSDGIPERNKYNETLKGSDLYDMLVQRAGGIMHSPNLDKAGIPSTLPGGTKERTGLYLANKGIPGIKYLDAGSRSAGEGTRNYVVFDDRLISIIRKYGIAGASAMLGYNLMENLNPEQARAAQAANKDYKVSGAVTGGMLPPGMEPSGELTSRTPTASERVYDYIRANLMGDEATKGQRADTAMNLLDQTFVTVPLTAYDLGRRGAEILGFADGGAVDDPLAFEVYDPDAEEAVALARRELQGPFPPSSPASQQPSDGTSVSRRPSKTERIIDILAPRVVDPAMQVKSLMDTPLHVLLGGGTPEEQDALIANSTNVASMMGGASSVVPRPANSLGIFGGIKSRTADKDALTKAQILESQGVSPDEIWRQAGWGRGAEEGWRYEIPDIGATVDPSKFQIDLTSLAIPSPKVARLGDYLNHPEFFAAYPEMKNIEVRFQPGTVLGNDYWGYYSPRYEKSGKVYEPYIWLNQDFLPTNEKQLSTLLHEIQHAVQQKEGFMRGANKEMFQPDTIPDPRVKLYEDAIKSDPELQEFVSIGNSVELQKQFDASHELYMKDVKPVLDDIRSREDEYGIDLNDEWMKTYRAHLAQVREMFPLIAKREDLGQSLENRGIPLSRPMKKFLTPSQAYEATSGEVEARNVQKRMNTEPSILKESPPWVTENVPRNQQLIDWNDTSWRKGYADGGEVDDDIHEALYIANGLNS